MPVSTTNRSLPIQINKNNASEREEKTELHHEETINENKQNILSQRPPICTNLHQHNDKQIWRHTAETVPANSFYKDQLNIDKRHT